MLHRCSVLGLLGGPATAGAAAAPCGSNETSALGGWIVSKTRGKSVIRTWLFSLICAFPRSLVSTGFSYSLKPGPSGLWHARVRPGPASDIPWRLLGLSWGVLDAYGISCGPLMRVLLLLLLLSAPPSPLPSCSSASCSSSLLLLLVPAPTPPRIAEVAHRALVYLPLSQGSSSSCSSSSWSGLQRLPIGPSSIYRSTRADP